MTHCLFSLSKYYLVSLFIDWLSVRDLGMIGLSLNKNGTKVFESLLTEFFEKFQTSFNSLRSSLTLEQIVSLCTKGLPMPGGLRMTPLFLNEFSQCFSIFRMSSGLHGAVCNYLGTLKVLELYPIPNSSFGILKKVFRLIPNLEEFVIHSLTNISPLLNTAGKCCVKLKKLIIHGKTTIEAPSLRLFLDRCSTLEELRLSGEVKYSGKDIYPLLSSLLVNYPALVNLHFQAHRLIPFPNGTLKCLVSLTCDYFSAEDFERFLYSGGGRNLTYLDVSRNALALDIGSDICRLCPSLVDLRVVSKIIKCCDLLQHGLTHLTTLYAVDVSCTKPEPIIHMAQLASITELCVPQCEVLMAGAFPRLTTLRLSHIGDIDAFTSTMIQSPRLTSLTISTAIHRLDYDSIETIDAACRCIGDHCSQLLALFIPDWNQYPIALASQLNELVEVGLPYSWSLYDFLKVSPLQKLHLYQCSMLSTDHFSAMIKCNPHLIELHLTFCKVNVDPAILRTILKGYSRLRRLFVRALYWNVWSEQRFKEELMRMRPDCLVAISPML